MGQNDDKIQQAALKSEGETANCLAPKHWRTKVVIRHRMKVPELRTLDTAYRAPLRGINSQMDDNSQSKIINRKPAR